MSVLRKVNFPKNRLSELFNVQMLLYYDNFFMPLCSTISLASYRISIVLLSQECCIFGKKITASGLSLRRYNKNSVRVP